MVAVACAVSSPAGCAAPTSAGIGAAPGAGTSRPQVVGEIQHDTSAFTEGLQIADGVLFESTGLAGHSELRALDPATGAVRRAVPLPGRLFGEGIAVVGDRIWQLTYQDGVVLEWDRTSLTVVARVPLTGGEGWGLCFDGARLVQSEGTDRLRFRNPTTFAQTGSVHVTLDGRPLDRLNELECVDGQVWANVWQTDDIVAIDPTSGRVTAVVDASGLLTPAQQAGTDVLNGIAWLGGDEFLLTGKFWPVMVRVRLETARPGG